MLNDGWCPQGALQDDGGTKQASADVCGLYTKPNESKPNQTQPFSI